MATDSASPRFRTNGHVCPNYKLGETKGAGTEGIIQRMVEGIAALFPGIDARPDKPRLTRELLGEEFHEKRDEILEIVGEAVARLRKRGED